MAAARDLLVGAVLGLVAVALQGCGGCAGPSGESKLVREEAIVRIVCTEVVAEELWKIEAKMLSLLGETCMNTTMNVKNLAEGRALLEEKCQGYGANHMLDAHALSEAFMKDNCTKWASEKIGPGPDSKKGKVKDVLDAATKCATEYSTGMADDFRIAEDIFDDAIQLANNRTVKLIRDLKLEARKVMNAHLANLKVGERFALTPKISAAPALGSAVPALALLPLLLVSLLAASALVPLCRHVRAGGRMLVLYRRAPAMPGPSE